MRRVECLRVGSNTIFTIEILKMAARNTGQESRIVLPNLKTDFGYIPSSLCHLTWLQRLVKL